MESTIVRLHNRGEHKLLPLFLPSQKSPKLTNVIMDGRKTTRKRNNQTKKQNENKMKTKRKQNKNKTKTKQKQNKNKTKTKQKQNKNKNKNKTTYTYG